MAFYRTAANTLKHNAMAMEKLVDAFREQVGTYLSFVFSLSGNLSSVFLSAEHANLEWDTSIAAT